MPAGVMPQLRRAGRMHFLGVKARAVGLDRLAGVLVRGAFLVASLVLGAFLGRFHEDRGGSVQRRPRVGPNEENELFNFENE